MMMMMMMGHMQVCTSLQTDNHASIPPLSFLQAGCPSCHPTNGVKALKATRSIYCGVKKGGPKKWGHRFVTIILSDLNRLKMFFTGDSLVNLQFTRINYKL